MSICFKKGVIVKVDKTLIEVYVLTGFLGSGKSTLLTRLIEYEKKRGRRIGVLMNELGQVSIDSSIVPANTPLQELLNGCICCTIQGELTSRLYQMVEEYKLDCIYIESTGVAHPIEILDACTHPSLVDKTKIKAIITVVDGTQWHDRHTMKASVRKLLEEQVKYTDVLLLNKMDLLVGTDVKSLCGNIRTFNSRALLIPTTNAEIDPSVLISSVHQEIDQHQQPKSHVHHHLHLRTFTEMLEEPLDRIAFQEWLKSIPGRIYRGKGFLHLTETTGIFLFQYAYGEPMFVQYQVDKPYQPVLVLIGEDLNHEQMKRDLKELQNVASVNRYRY